MKDVYARLSQGEIIVIIEKVSPMLQEINNGLSKIIDGMGEKGEGECNQLTKVFCTDAN